MIMRIWVALVLVLSPSTQEARRPLPPEPARQTALKSIRDIFKEEYAKKSLDDRRKLARKLLQQAIDTKDDAPSEYVLLQESRSLGAESSDIETALRAVAELGRKFEMDVLPLRLATLATASQSTKNPDDLSSCALQYIALSDEAARSLDLATAEKALSSAAALAKGAKNIALSSKIDAKSKQLSGQKSKLTAVKKAQEALAKNAEDPEANAVVGSFVAFIQEDWPKGLAYLTKGPNGPAKTAAELDLSNPSDPVKQAEVGDAWWTLAETAPEEQRKTLKRRGSSWYEKARAGITGLGKVKLEKRLAEVPAPELPVPTDADPAAAERWVPTPALSLSANKATIKDALAQLTQESGYAVSLGDVDPNLRVTYRVEGTGFMGALDTLCRAGGVTYAWDEEGTVLQLTKAKWLDSAATNFGPFLLTGQVRTDNMKIARAFLYLDWEPGVKPAWYEITVEGATSDTGTPIQAAGFQMPTGAIRDSNQMGRMHPRSTKFISRREHQKDAFLLDPAPGVGKKLTSIRGKVDVYFPLKWGRARFDNPAKDATAQAGPHLITLGLYDPGKVDEPWHISFSLGMATIPVDKRFAVYGATLEARARFLDAGGRTLSSEFKGNAGFSGFGTREGFVSGNRGWLVRGVPKGEAPKLAEIELVTDVWIRTYKFELRDVPQPAIPK